MPSRQIHQMKLKFAPNIFFFIGIFSLLIFSCNNEEAKKKKVRNKWYEYYFAMVERAHIGIGTDSTVVEFQNHSDYDVDSVAIVFNDRGLFVNSFDTLHASNIHANAHKQIVVPYHVFGVSKTAQIIFIRSKQLEFCFTLNGKKMSADDPYYCK